MQLRLILILAILITAGCGTLSDDKSYTLEVASGGRGVARGRFAVAMEVGGSVYGADGRAFHKLDGKFRPTLNDDGEANEPTRVKLSRYIGETPNDFFAEECWLDIKPAGTELTNRECTYGGRSGTGSMLYALGATLDGNVITVHFEKVGLEGTKSVTGEELGLEYTISGSVTANNCMYDTRVTYTYSGYDLDSETLVRVTTTKNREDCEDLVSVKVYITGIDPVAEFPGGNGKRGFDSSAYSPAEIAAMRVVQFMPGVP